MARDEPDMANEIELSRQRIRWVVKPADVADFPDSDGIFAQHMHESPLIRHYGDPAGGTWLKISDFMTRRQFRRTAIYNDYYRRKGTESQIAIMFPSRREVSIAIALSRGRRDFSERERLLLNVLTPHLTRAYQTAEAFSQMRQDVVLFRKGLATLHPALIVLTADWRIEHATPAAEARLSEYFGKQSPDGRLPVALAEWVPRQERDLGRMDSTPAPREPLVVERDGKRLVVRLVSDQARTLLLLEEQYSRLPSASLESFGLSRREAEVLSWVAEGKTSPEIAIILGVSPCTIHHHLEHIYAKLGVETRTAALALALRHVEEFATAVR